MGLPIINGVTWATWNGIIRPPESPIVPFESPVLRGSGASVLPIRSPDSPVITHAFVKLRSEADALIANCAAIRGYLITASDDEGVSYSNLFVKSVICAKPRKVQGETNDGTAGLVYLVAAQWVFQAPLPENA